MRMLRSMGDNKADQDIAGLMSELSALDEMEAEIRQSAEEKADMRDKMMQELVSLRQDKDNTAKKMTEMVNKWAQRALGRSPEEKVKSHSGANNREPQGHNFNNFGRAPFDDVIY